MVEVYEAAPVTSPVFDAVEVGETTSQLSQQKARPLTIPELAQLLSERGKLENHPGWVQSVGTLYKRIGAINAPVRQFQWEPYRTLTPYQIWVVIKIHEDYFKLTPRSLDELTSVLRANEKHYSKESYDQWKEQL